MEGNIMEFTGFQVINRGYCTLKTLKMSGFLLIKE